MFIHRFLCAAQDCAQPRDNQDCRQPTLRATRNLIREFNILVLYEQQILREINLEQINQYKQYLRDKIGSSSEADERDKRPACKKDIYLPVGFNLNCGVRGSFLSGGQK